MNLNRVLLLILLAVHAGAVSAEQRALLVGVGKYEIPGNDLPGIDLDLDRMTDTLKVMGFEDHQIRRLLDHESTAENILHEMNTWLVEGVEEDDRVVFYYSGHGSFIPDQDGDETDDQVDEVLVAHDVRLVRVDGKRSLRGVVTDDQIAEAIARSKSRNYLTIVDACHSGTVTRDILLGNRSLSGEPVYEKAFVYKGMPVGFDTFKTVERSVSRDAGEQNFVSISAAGDGEKAIGTARGGVFTIGLSEAIMNAARYGHPVTLQQARDIAAEFIKARVDAQRVHTPQITGNIDLAGSNLVPGTLAGGYGPMWQRLEALVGEGQYFRMQAGQPSYVLDESITFTLDVPESGYLNLLSVDAQDTATVLFPNEWDDDNFVEAGEFTFPTEANRFDLGAARPLGPTLVIAFVSENPVNFRDYGIDGRLPDGDIDPAVVFTNVTYAATRAIKVRRRPEPQGSVIADAGNATAAETQDDGNDSLAAAAAVAVGTAAAVAGAAATVDVDVSVSPNDDNPAESPAAAETQAPEPEPGPEPEDPWLYASSLEITVREAAP